MAHVTIPDEAGWVKYTATAGQTDFTFTFSAFEKANLIVSQNGTDLLTSDWTVAWDTSATGGYTGGTITLNSAAAANDIIEIRRHIVSVRTSDFDSGPFDYSALNTELDIISAIGRDLQRETGRSVLVPLGEAGIDFPAAATRANTAFAFDGSGNLELIARTDLEALGARTAQIDLLAARTDELDAIYGDLSGLDTIGDAAALLAVSGPCIIAKNALGVPVAREITVGSGLSISNGDGGAGNPEIALDADLEKIAGLPDADGTFLVGSPSGWVAETGDTALASLGGGTAGIAIFKRSNAADIRSDLSLVPGTDVQAYSGALAILASNPLTAVEFTQLQNINTTSISVAQWAYLGQMDQAVDQAASPSFQSVTSVGDASVSGVSISPSGAAIGQALGFPNSASVAEPYTPSGGGNVRSNVAEIIEAQWSFNRGVIIGHEVWPDVSSARTGAENLAAIQDAIDSNPNGTVINLPGEEFEISGALNLRGTLNNKTHITLRGAGMFSTTVDIDDATGKSGEWVNGGSGFCVEHMTIRYPALSTFPYFFSANGLTSSTSTVVNNAGGYSIGANTLNLDGAALVGQVGPGDRIEFTGHAQAYIVQNVVTASGNELNGVQIYPALTTAVSDNQNVFIQQSAGYFGLSDGTSNALMPSGTSALRLHFNLMETSRVANPAPEVGDQFFLISENRPQDSANFQNTVPYRIASVGALVGSYTAASYWPITVEHWNGSAWVSGLSTDQPNGIMVSTIQDYRNNIYNGLSLHHCDDSAIRFVRILNARLHGISVGSSSLNAPNAYRTLGSATQVRSSQIEIDHCIVGRSDDPTNTHVQGSLISGGQLNQVRIRRCNGYGNIADTAPPGSNYNYGIFFEKFTDLSVLDCFMSRCLEGYRFTNFAGLKAAHWTAIDCRNGWIQDQNGRGYAVTNFYIGTKDYASLTQIGFWARTGEILTGTANNVRDASGTVSNGLIQGVGSASYGTNIGFYIEGANTPSNDSDDIGLMTVSGVQVIECFKRGFQIDELRRGVLTNCVAAYNGGAGLYDLNSEDVTVSDFLAFDNCQSFDNAGVVIDGKTGGLLAGIISSPERDSTQDYGVEWLNTSTGVRIGLNNDFRGTLGRETGTRPALKATIIGDIEMQSDQSTGTFSDGYKMLGLDDASSRVPYAAIRGSVRNNTAGAHSGRLYVSVAHAGALVDRHYFENEGLVLNGNLTGAQGIFSGDVTSGGQLQGETLRLERATGESTVQSVTGSSTGNLFGWTANGNNNSAAEVSYGRIRCGVRSNAAGNHAGRWVLEVAQGGVLTEIVQIENGIVVPGAAGLANDRGRGTIDVDSAYYVQGNKVLGTQGAAVADTVITYTANDPGITPDNAVTIADGSAPTVSELLELIVELKHQVETMKGRLVAHGLIAT